MSVTVTQTCISPTAMRELVNSNPEQLQLQARTRHGVTTLWRNSILKAHRLVVLLNHPCTLILFSIQLIIDCVQPAFIMIMIMKLVSVCVHIT